MKPTDWPIPRHITDPEEREAIAKCLRHEDTVLLDFQGEKRPYLLCRRSMRLAEAQGVDVDAALTMDATASTVQNFDRLIDTLFTGFVAFDPDLQHADIVAAAEFMSTGDLIRVQLSLAEAAEKMRAVADEMEGNGVGAEPMETLEAA